MSFLDYFRATKPNSANVAKERLQIIIAHERSNKDSPDYLPRMQQEILDVVARYVDIDRDQVRVAFDRDGDSTVLELNVILPEAVEA